MSNHIIYINMFAMYCSLAFIGPFISSYFQHYTGASGVEVGTVELLSAMLSLPFSLTISSMADRHRAHRIAYLITLMMSLILYSSLLIPALLKIDNLLKLNTSNQVVFTANDEQHQVQLNHNSDKFDYSNVTSSLQSSNFDENANSRQATLWYYLISIVLIIINSTTKINISMSSAFAANLSAKLNIAYGSIRLWGSFGLVFSSIVLILIKDIKSLGFLVPPFIAYTVVGTAHWLFIAMWPDKRPFELSNKADDISPINYVNYDAGTVFNYNEKFIFKRGTIKDYRGDFKMVFQELDGNRNTSNNKEANTNYDKQPLLANFRNFEFDELTESNCSSEESSMLKNNHNQCVVDANNFNNDHGEEKPIKIGLYLRVIMMIIANNKYFIRFIFIFIACGFITVASWVYLMPYLKSIYQDDFLTISSYLMFGRYISEMLFYFASPIISRNVEHSLMLTISMVANAIKFICYILYQEKISLIYIVMLEILWAPINALFFCAMNEISIKFSLESKDCVGKLIEKSLIDNNNDSINRITNGFKATMVALSSRCFDSIGFGLGSIAGGWIVDRDGYTRLWQTCAIIAGFCALFNIVFDIKNYIKTRSNKYNNKNFQTSIQSTSSSESNFMFNITEHLSESESLGDKCEEELDSTININK